MRHLLRLFSIWPLVLASLSAFSSPAFSATAAPRPNIVIVFIDDMGWADLSCFGNEDAHTPHIDQLAEEGLRFNHFHVAAPICSPSRAGLLTGQYPQRWHIGSFLGNRAENEKRGIAHWLDPQAPTLARFLQKSGYATGHFGKWHLGGQRDVDDAPLITAYGFDQSLTNFEGLGPRILPTSRVAPGQPERRHDLGSARLGHGSITWESREKVTTRFVDAALGFIDTSLAAKKPFYLNLWPDDVHTPVIPSFARREAIAKGDKRALYLAVLEEMDAQLAPLFDRIRNEPALRNNTIILVASDNGHEPGAGSGGPLRGAKGTLYEGGTRSPLIVWSPALLAPESVGALNKTSVLSALDLTPSLLALVGATPSASEVKFAGEHRLDTLLGHAAEPRKTPLFFRRPPDRKTNPRYGDTEPLPDLALRDGSWKFLCDYDGAKPELYDLASDPSESRNLAAAQPELVQTFTDKLLTWHRTLPTDRGASYQENAGTTPRTIPAASSTPTHAQPASR